MLNLKIHMTKSTKLWLPILAFIILLIGIFYIASTAFEKEKFAEGARIEMIVVSDLTRSEAVQKVQEAVAAWQAKSTVVLMWQDKEQAIAPEAFAFDIQTAVQSASLETGGQLVVHMNEVALQEALERLVDPTVIDLLNREELKKALRDLASALTQQPIKLDLASYMKGSVQSPETVSASAIPVETSASLSSWVKKLDGMLIKPMDTVSFLSVLEENPGLTPSGLNMLASGLYEALLNTNFEIIERHIGNIRPAYGRLGFEAKIVPGKFDFVFKNPNPTRYRISFHLRGNHLHTSVQGLPLPQQYRTAVSEAQEFPPKTIVHFNPHLNPYETRVKEAGQPGALVKVYREESGNAATRKKQLVSEDFYPPVHRVIEQGISSFEAEIEPDQKYAGSPVDPAENLEPGTSDPPNDDPTAEDVVAGKEI